MFGACRRVRAQYNSRCVAKEAAAIDALLRFLGTFASFACTTNSPLSHVNIVLAFFHSLCLSRFPEIYTKYMNIHKNNTTRICIDFKATKILHNIPSSRTWKILEQKFAKNLNYRSKNWKKKIVCFRQFFHKIVRFWNFIEFLSFL